MEGRIPIEISDSDDDHLDRTGSGVPVAATTCIDPTTDRKRKSEPDVEYVGTNHRPINHHSPGDYGTPPAVAAAPAVPSNDGWGLQLPSLPSCAAALRQTGSGFDTAMNHLPAVVPHPAPQNIHSSNNNNKKKKRQKLDPNWKPPPKPMEKGKTLAQPTGFDSIDMYYPHLKAAERTAVLQFLMPSKTKQSLHQKRVAYDKAHPKATLWSTVAAVSGQVAAEDANHKNRKPPPPDQKQPASVPTIGSLGATVLQTLRTYFTAYRDRVYHQQMLDQIEPASNKDNSAVACSICSDIFDPTDTVPCSGQTQVHFFCKPCFYSYVTVTLQSGPIQAIACPCPGCDSLFATHDAKANISEWDLLRIEDRENSRNRRVALAAKAALHCECGTVGIITESDIGNGRVPCPGCDRRYCCKCGNADHGTEACPPPAETVQWLDQNTKECPNCHNRIEKNGGCDHMTCRPPEGCEHEFWWTCLCPYKGRHKSGCSRR